MDKTIIYKLVIDNQLMHEHPGHFLDIVLLVNKESQDVVSKNRIPDDVWHQMMTDVMYENHNWDVFWDF